MTYGLHSTGFTAPTAAAIEESIVTDQRALIGADVETGAEAIIGQLNGIMSERLRQAWEGIAAVYASMDPDQASGAALDARSRLTGATRRAATYGTVTLSLTLNAGVTVGVGRQAQVPGSTTSVWTLIEAATNDGGSPATVTVRARCATAGRIVANSGTITGIATPVSGWTAVTNAADASAGKDAESDAEFRVRRETELQAAGTSPVDAIRSVVSAVDDVVKVTVDENVTDATGPTGIPPHSVEVVVQGGADADIAAAILGARAGGVGTYGTTTTTALDAGGVTRTVRFTRPSDRNVYITVDVRRGALYAGDTAVRDAVLAVGAAQLMGAALQLSDIIVAVRALAGVTNCRVLIGGTIISRVAADFAVGAREIAKMDSSRIAVGSL